MPATPVYYYAGISDLGNITCRLYAVDPVTGAAAGDTITLVELLDSLSAGMGIYAATTSVGLAGLYWAVLSGGMVDGGFVQLVATTAICVIQAGKFDITIYNKLPVNNIADQTILLTAINDAGGIGPGANACTFTFRHSGVPDINAEVWITSDPAGTDTIAGSLHTNDNGQVTFMLDDGLLYYLWFVCPGQDSIKGDPFYAEAD